MSPSDARRFPTVVYVSSDDALARLDSSQLDRVVGRVALVDLAEGSLLTTSATMVLGGANPAALAVEAMSIFWGFAAGLADVVQVVFAAVGSALLVALAVGAFVDLALVAVYLSVSRRRAREA